MFNKQFFYKFIIINSIFYMFNTANGYSSHNNCDPYNWKIKTDPYLGIDYKISYTKGVDYWKKLLPTNKIYQHGSLFTGIRFHNFISLEFGYSKSGKISKVSDVSGNVMWGVLAPNGTYQNIKLSYNSWHTDLNLQYPKEGFTFLLTIGAASTKPKILATNLSNPANNLIQNIIGKNKIIPRIGLGFQYTRGMFGLRSRVILENNARLKVSTNEVDFIFPNITDKSFKNTYLWNLGLFLNI